MGVLKSPILWAVIGGSAAIFGFMTSDEEKYPTLSKLSGWILIAGLFIVGFSTANIIKWNPLTKLNVA